mgnify:CR=1 FL=1
MKTAVVIPAYKVKDKIIDLINNIGDEVAEIYVIDDKCPEKSGNYVLDNNNDSRVEVIFNDKNKGVGGAVITGYKKALENKIDIVVKLDGDGQMDPGLIPGLIKPITNLEADYVKGNRFYNVNNLLRMPAIRLFGNICS